MTRMMPKMRPCSYQCRGLDKNDVYHGNKLATEKIDWVLTTQDDFELVCSYDV